MYFDKVEISNYSRDRTWKKASDLRIEELRKNDVIFKESSIDPKWPDMTQNDLYSQKEFWKIENPEVQQLEIKMLKNAYPFGGHINKYMMDDDYQRTNWPVLFNYGVAAVSTTLCTTPITYVLHQSLHSSLQPANRFLTRVLEWT